MQTVCHTEEYMEILKNDLQQFRQAAGSVWKDDEQLEFICIMR